MQTHTTIVVGLDFTILDNLLIRRAAQMAQLLRADKLIVVHIIDDVEAPVGLLPDFRVIHEEEEHHLRRELAFEVEDNLPTDHAYDIEYIVRRGRPLQEFFNLCGERHIELMILGRKKELRGKGILPFEMARYAACPILFVPENVKVRLKELMVCNDFSCFSRNAMEYAIRLASQNEEHITVYSQHVFAEPAIDDANPEPETDSITQHHHRLIRQYNQFINGMELGEVHVKPLFTNDHHHTTQAVIYEEAKKKHIDLLLIGSRSRSVDTPVFMGSMTEKLLRLAHDIPVLIVKRPIESGNQPANAGRFDQILA